MMGRNLFSLAVISSLTLLSASASAQAIGPLATEGGCDALVDSGEGVRVVPDVAFNVIGRDWDSDPLPELPGGAAVRCIRASVVPHALDWLVIQSGHALYLVEESGEAPRISVLETSGGQFRFRMARGTLSETERELLGQRLRNFQQLGPGGAPRESVVSGEARVGDFRVVQLWTDDPDRFLAAWSGPTPPQLNTTSKAGRGEILRQFIIFNGCKQDTQGNCQLHARFEFYRPDGSRDDDDIDFAIWEGEAPASGRLTLSPQGAAVVIGDSDPLGEYEARLVITDAVANATTTSRVNLTFEEGGD